MTKYEQTLNVSNVSVPSKIIPSCSSLGFFLRSDNFGVECKDLMGAATSDGKLRMETTCG